MLLLVYFLLLCNKYMNSLEREGERKGERERGEFVDDGRKDFLKVLG